MIEFSISPDDAELIEKIVTRAFKELYTVPAADWRRVLRESQPSKLHVLMDLTAVHANGNPLYLRELLNAPPFDFAHDIYGIRRHLDRETGELTNCFVPRYSVIVSRETPEVA
jgi:hypothetical protein